MRDRIIRPASKGLTGTITVPGDKSISHRAVMLGSLANGITRISHFLPGADCLATIDCFRRMGIAIETNQTGNEVIVHGKGLRGLSAPADTSFAELYTGNSGTTTRLISGILSGQNFSSRLSGDASLNARPMKRIIKPLQAMGANIKSVSDSGCAPLIISPGKLRGIHWHSKVASAQVKSALLLAGLYAEGETTVTEPSLSRDHTERMLRGFGGAVTSNGNTATVCPCGELYAQDISVPGDISSAAYFIAAALLLPGSELLIRDVGVNPTRAGMIQICQNMGGNITFDNFREVGGEPVADLLVKHSSLHGVVIEGDVIPALIDEIPVLAVLAAFAEGKTTIRDASELKVKETNRIDTITENLTAMGGDIIPADDGMIIQGGKFLHGAFIQSHMDHRIAMAFTIAALAADGESRILDSQCVDVSYPGFFEDLL